MSIETKEIALKQRAKILADQYDKEGASQAILRDMNVWEGEWKAFKAEKSADVVGKLRASGGDLGSAPRKPSMIEGRVMGGQASPMSFDAKDLRAAYKAVEHGSNFRITCKDTLGYSTVDSLLPAHLAPGVLQEQHEWRILEHLPAMAVGVPSTEFLIHNFPSDSGGPGVTAEGAAKPSYVPAVTSSTATVVKLAMHTGITTETLADAPTWESYVTNQCFRLIGDLENSQFLYGSGSDGNMTGFAHTENILTHNASSDPSGSTNLDSLELAITAMRNYAGVFSVPNLLVMSPTTWSATRRLKSTIDTYILGDPLSEGVKSAWGIPVLTTTAAENGDAFLIDTTRMGFVLVRSGIEMHTGYADDDLISNVVRFVFEERLTLAVERPQAVQYITNLATS